MKLMSKVEYLEHLRLNFIKEFETKVQSYFNIHGYYPSVALVSKEEYEGIENYLKYFFCTLEGIGYELQVLGITLKVIKRRRLVGELTCLHHSILLKKDTSVEN